MLNSLRPKKLVLSLIALCCAALAYGLLQSTGKAQEQITVFAGAGMSDALREVAQVFEREEACELRFSFAASSTLARQIVAGAAPDLFIAAHPKWMDFLEEKKLIDPELRLDLLGNRMVCIAPRTLPPHTHELKSWFHLVEGRIAMGDPDHVPAGIYGAQALKALGIWEEVQDRLAPAADTRAALRAVALGECNAGIVYATDAKASASVIEVGRFSEELHEAIRFPAALCPQAKASGIRFLRFLQSPSATSIFEKHGFCCLSKKQGLAKAAPLPFTGLSSEEKQALSLSLRVAMCSVLILLLPGVFTGWILARCQFPGKGALEAMTHLPMVVPPVVTGYLLLLLLGKNGYLGAFLDQSFNIRLGFSFWAAAIASAVMAFPLMVRAVRLAIELIGSDLEEAAMMNGAGPLWRFLTVTLPLAGPGIIAGMVLAFSRSLGEFGATMTFAGNIPGETQTMPLAIYSALQRPEGEDAVLRLALFSVLIAILALWASRRLESWMRHGGAQR